MSDAAGISYPDQPYMVYWRDGQADHVKKPITRGDIAGLFDDTFTSAVGLWKLWKSYGLPHGGGWLDERVIVLQAISTVEEERNFFDHCEIDEKRKKTRGSS